MTRCFLRFVLFFVSTAAFAAEPADWLLSARWVVPMDASRRIIENGAVAVKSGSIVAVGTRVELAKRFTPKQTFHRADTILMPGLINTHTHAAMSLFRGIADDMRLQDWLEKFIFPAEARNVTADFVRWGTRLAALEMVLGGTTTFTDMYYFEEVVAEAAKEAGLRGVLGQTIIGFPVPDAKTPADGLARTEAFLKRFANDPLIVPAVAPHALYTNSDETLRNCRALADRYKAPLLIHLSETKRENDDIGAKRGKSPTAVLDEIGVLDGRTLGAHGVWLDDADLAILKRRGTGIAHCPSSNMKLASGIAPVVKMLALGIPVGLGPDGPAGSNNDFSMFEEMDLAAKLAKVSTNDPQSVSAQKSLEMATIDGARALGMDTLIGSLEPGKHADLIFVRTNAAHAVPLYNAYSQLAYALKANDVSDVMVNGRWIVRARIPQTLNPSIVLAKAREYQQRILASLKP
ncbi:MAG TPA: amidohydrolase family protein [Bryobacteraceae bacterium]|nr:amidohydrolase family protein [Bryobacteraceae bacterium]